MKLHNVALWRCLKSVRKHVPEKMSSELLEKCTGDRNVEMNSAAYEKIVSAETVLGSQPVSSVSATWYFHNTVKLTYFTTSCLAAVHNNRFRNVKNVEWPQQLF